MKTLVEITEKNFPFVQEDILRIEKSCFLSPWTLKAFQEEARNPMAHFWAVCLGGGLSGYVCFWTFSGEMHLLNLAVAPETRRRGLGLFMIERMIRFAQINNIHLILLEVRPSNHAARKLYEKMNFRELFRRPRYYRDTQEDALVMALYLPEKRRDPETQSAPGMVPLKPYPAIASNGWPRSTHQEDEYKRL